MDELRSRLFAAVHVGDRDLLWRLCADHRDEVVAHFAEWRRVPESAREKPDQLERYASGLLGVAACFAERLGDSGLLESLTGEDGAQLNPLVSWEEALVEATQSARELDYEAAIRRLVDVLIDTRDLRGSGVDHYLPRTYGLLGDCYFQSRRAEDALRPLLNALDGCEEQGDEPGIRTYLGRLYEAHRYLGQDAEAADYARRLARLCERDGLTARWFEVQAERLEVGEPLCRVVLEVEGVRVELDDAKAGPTGPFRFVYVRNRPPLQAARIWTQRGEVAGRRGELEEALGCFSEAREADPFDPHSRYLAGTLCLNAERYYEAIELFAQAEELAPGWFEVRTRLRLARELALGQLQHKVLSSLRTLERADATPAKSLELVKELREELPSHSLLLLHHGRCLARAGDGPGARARYAEGLHHSESDVAIATRLHLELGLASPPEERSVHLQRARDLGGHLVAAATATLLLRSDASAADAEAALADEPGADDGSL